MTEKVFLTQHQVEQRAQLIAAKIPGTAALYGIPRGGIPAVYLVAAAGAGRFRIVDKLEEADYLIDDIVDSGATRRRYNEITDYQLTLYALVDKQNNPEDRELGWIVFPWEGDTTTSAQENVTRLLQYIGEDVNREGLVDTPARVIRAFDHWFSGYSTDVTKLFTVFKVGGENCDEMVVVKNIPFYSHCEHHIAPFFGTATIAYLPKERIVGLSKIVRLLDAYSRRLQVQERLTNQIVDALVDNLQPLGAGCVITGRHLCMESRGVQRPGAITVTSALRGNFKENATVRNEFMQLANKE